MTTSDETGISHEHHVLMLDGKPYGVVCGRCQSSMWKLSSFGGGAELSLQHALQAASRCCGEQPCAKCGSPIKPHSFCLPCHLKEDAERTQRDFDKATKLPVLEYTGTFVTDGDEQFVESCDWRDVDDPIELADGTRFLWGTRPEKPSVDLERVCSEDWLQGHHEDAYDQVDTNKLREAQKLVDEALARVVSYYEDRSVALLLPPPDEDEDEDEERDPVNGQLVSARAS